VKTARICVFGLVLGCTAPPSATEGSPEASPDVRMNAESPGPELEGRGLTRIATGLPDVNAICERLQTHECPSLGSGECTCDTSHQGTSGWALIGLTNLSHGTEVWYPGIRTTSGWTVFASLVQNDTKVWASSERVEWDPPQQQDLLPGDDPEFEFAFSKRQFTAASSVNPDDWEFEWKLKMVCTRVGTRAQCTRPLLEDYSGRRLNPDGGEDHGTERYQATVALGADVVVSQLTSEDTSPRHDEHFPEVLVLSPGTHALAELLAPAPARVGDSG
jgi:hypothetical protein